PLELGDSRIQCAVPMIGRAEEAYAGMRLQAEALLYRLGNPRLADTRLSRDQDDRAIARFRLGPTPHQQLDLLLAPDQLRPCAAQRLEATLERARPPRRPCPHRFGDALDFPGPEVLQLEQISEQF